VSKKKVIKPCSCEESVHLRKALRTIVHFASEETYQDEIEDLIQINNLAHQALELAPLVGDQAIGKVVVK
jgi:hypothetical protein